MDVKRLYDRLAAPAQRALDGLQLGRIEDLAARTEAELEGLHGIGPAALRVIKEELAGLGLGLKEGDGKSLVDEYIKAFPRPVREKLEALRSCIREAAPEATERISYGMPTFYLEGNLVHFAGFKGHIGFYPTPSGTSEFRERLAPYKHAKGSVQFPLDEDLPLDLVRQIVEFRIAEKRGR
jgi:uncharacterized protein YdhG (YjbR/CyaY superfamily)